MPDRYIEVAGCRLRYRETGRGGPSILFVHGIGGSLELWSKQWPLADEGKHLIFLDLPGHGLSTTGDRRHEPASFAEIALQFLSKIEVEKATVVGNSMGGAIAILMAAKAPNRIERLLLADAATLGRGTPLPFRLMTLPVLGPLMTRARKEGAAGQIQAIFFDPDRCVTPEQVAAITRNVSNADCQRAFLSTLRLMTGLTGQNQAMVERSHKALRDIKVPVTFLHGREDAVLPLEHSVHAQTLTRDSTLVILERCGHTPQVEQAQDFNAALRQLLAR